MRINEIVYGCSEHHSSLNAFKRIDSVVEKICGNIEVTGTCCTCHEQKQKDYCKECLR